jgi:hypothetical protein
MHRLIVVLLAAFDAALAVAVGVAAVLAPLTLVWVFAFGDTADWGALWPASTTVWQLGHLVPLAVTLPGEYLAAAGIDESAASFTVSLAPLAFATFTAIFAARSGSRASRADAWLTGVVTGTVVVAALATLIGITSRNDLAGVELWQAIVFPTLLYALPALGGALVTEWADAPTGVIARLRDRAEDLPGGWAPVIGVSARSSAIAVVGLIGTGALIVALALFLRAGDVVALSQAGNLDLVGGIVMTLAQLAYLPTLVVWGVSFVAGPGFALGDGTAVSPSGTQVGVVPGIPLLGAVPESTSPWLLLLVLLPIAVGALAGWVARSRLLVAAGYVPPARPAKTPRAKKSRKKDAAAPPSLAGDSSASLDDERRSALQGLLEASPPRVVAVDEVAPVDLDDAASSDLDQSAEILDAPAAARLVHEPLLPRLVVTVVISVVSAAAAALLCAFASGSAGPGSLAEVGPASGPVALAVGLEVVVGAGILLLSSRRGTVPADDVSEPPSVD